MAVKVVLLASREQSVDVWVTSCSEEVVTAEAIFVGLVLSEAVRNDSEERSEIRETGPETVSSGKVGGMELASTGRPEAFTRIVEVPNIEITW